MRHALIGVALIATLAAASAGDDIRLGTHAVRGRVRSVSTTALVIRRSSNAERDMRFVLNGATEREGPILVGAPVSIRYVAQGEVLIATAVASESRGCTPRAR